MKLNIALIILSLFVLSSCAGHPHVRAGATGVHRVLIRGTEKETIERQAINEAENFCESKNLSPAFVSENTAYTGSMDEKTHKTIQKVSKAATVGGSMVGVMGGTNRDRRSGQGVMGAGVVGSVFQDEEAYTADMSFKCI